MDTNSEKASRTVWSAGAILVLVAALGVGLGIRKLRTWKAEADQEAVTHVKAEPKAEKQPEVEPVKREEVEVVDVVDEEVVEAVEPEEEEVEVAAATEEIEEQEPEEERRPMRGPGMMGGAGERWRQVWADLNFTPEEQERLRAGWQLAMERFRSMSEEDRQAEMARFQDMRAQWEAMSDEERDEAMGRMRDRFEDWRASGAVELPELTLD